MTSSNNPSSSTTAGPELLTRSQAQQIRNGFGVSKILGKSALAESTITIEELSDDMEDIVNDSSQGKGSSSVLIEDVTESATGGNGSPDSPVAYAGANSYNRKVADVTRKIPKKDLKIPKKDNKVTKKEDHKSAKEEDGGTESPAEAELFDEDDVTYPKIGKAKKANNFKPEDRSSNSKPDDNGSDSVSDTDGDEDVDPITLPANFEPKLKKGVKCMDQAAQFKQAGNALYKRQNYEQAVGMWFSALRKIIKGGKHKMLSKDDSLMETSLYLNLAQGHLQMGEYDRTIKATEVVLHGEPRNEKALYREAEAYFHKGDTKKCGQLLERLEETGTILIKIKITC